MSSRKLPCLFDDILTIFLKEISARGRRNRNADSEAKQGKRKNKIDGDTDRQSAMLTVIYETAGEFK